jgi:DNA-binding transcriptional ArsR family regulator
MNVGGLSERLAMRQQAVSHHLTIMKLTRMVEFRRQGKTNSDRLTYEGREAMALARSLFR